MRDRVREGVAVAGTVNRPRVEIDELCERWNQGQQVREIAGWLGRTPGATAKLVERLRRAGHPLTNRVCDAERAAVQRRARILELVDTHTRGEIADALGLSAERISADVESLRRNGHVIQLLTDARRRRLRVRDLVRAGRCRREIAGELGVSVHTVRGDLKWLRRKRFLGRDEYAGGARPARASITVQEGRLIRDLWNADVGTREIAARVGREPAVITRYVCARRRARGDVKRRYRSRQDT